MHARTEQLLSLRDGEPVDAQVALHLDQCPACSKELKRLKQMRDALQSLAPAQPSAAAWAGIRAELNRRAVKPGLRRRIGSAVAAASIVVFICVAALRWAERSPPPEAQTFASHSEPPRIVATPAADMAVAQLVAQSRRLDEMLQRMPRRPQIERVAMAATVDTIEQRIQWLDLQLSFEPEPESDLGAEQAQRLWRERVELMDSLVKVRYAQIQGRAF